jgi:hypothetical protein
MEEEQVEARNRRMGHLPLSRPFTRDFELGYIKMCHQERRDTPHLMDLIHTTQ